MAERFEMVGNSKRGDDVVSEAVAGLRAMLEDRRRDRQVEAGVAEAAGERDVVVRSGLEALDEALPGGGFSLGSVVEFLRTGSGAGAMGMALRVARAAAECRDSPSPIVVIDGAGAASGKFYPPAGMRLGMDFSRLWVIRPVDERAAFWALDQCLRCRAVGAVVATVGELDEPSSRRLQLAAECGGGMGILLRPAQTRGRSFAAVRMLIEPVAGNLDIQNTLPRRRWDSLSSFDDQFSSPHRLVRVTLIRVREGRPVGPFVVELPDEASFVPICAPSVDRTVEANGRREAG